MFSRLLGVRCAGLCVSLCFQKLLSLFGSDCHVVFFQRCEVSGSPSHAVTLFDSKLASDSEASFLGVLIPVCLMEKFNHCLMAIHICLVCLSMDGWMDG